MQWKLSEEQEAYRQALRDWLSNVASAEQVRSWWEAEGGRGGSSEFEERFVRDGMAGVGIAEKRGGQGGGVVELALTAEELGRAAAPSAGWLATVLAAGALPTADVQAAIGGANAALLAPADAVPAQAPTVSIEPGGRVNGVIPRVLAGGQAASYVAVVGDGGRRSLRLVRSGEGVTVTPRNLLDRSRAVADVRVEGVASEPLDVDADEYLLQTSALAAVLIAADTLGASQRMLNLAVEYSKQRQQFGKPIGSFQAVKHAAATILVGVEAARSGIYLAAAAVDARHAENGTQAAAMKAQVTAEGARAADSALTIHGAIGYTWEHDLHPLYKRAKLNEYLCGSPRAWNEQIADGLLLCRTV